MAYLTHCELLNLAGTFVTLDFSYFTGAPKMILEKETAKFTQNPYAESWNSGVVYVLGNKIKWVVLWSNDYKVYTRILKREDTITWVEIISNLNNSSNESSNTDHGYWSKAQINSRDGTPTVRATLKIAT